MWSYILIKILFSKYSINNTVLFTENWKKSVKPTITLNKLYRLYDIVPLAVLIIKTDGDHKSHRIKN